MTYPQFVSPTGKSYIVIEFTAPTIGRIILATHKKQQGPGYNSPVGTLINSWVSLEESYTPDPIPDGKYSFKSWQPASIDILCKIPYIQHHYPELLI